MFPSLVLSRTGIPLLFVAAAILLFSGSPMRAGALEDFESAPPTIAEPNSDDATKCEVVVDPAKAGNHVLQLSWAPHTGSHVGGNLATPRAELIEEMGKFEISARVNLEGCPNEVTELVIRVVDSGNETFQYSASLEQQGEPGWTEVTWPVDTNEPIVGAVKSWGDRIDEVLDFPVRFYGFALNLQDGQTGGGTVQFDEISVKKVAD